MALIKTDRLYKWLLLVLLWSSSVIGLFGVCDQKPPDAATTTPLNSKNSPYSLKITTKLDGNTKFLPGQTYVLILESSDLLRPFKGFMITVEDAQMDLSKFTFQALNADVGHLETLPEDLKSKHSERCPSSVENIDNSDKTRIEIHWVSPKVSAKKQKIRFRAMVAENDETWYTGDTLTLTLERENSAPVDEPPIPPRSDCSLCSEARYELIFRGQWSRGNHSLHYPSKPDEIKFSHMVGASHHHDYILWEKGVEASDPLRELAEDASILKLEKDIIANMFPTNGTRTLIRGINHRHPEMHKPSHSLFRVDRYHHLFSILVAFKPSPDWFLGISRFELCTDEGWFEHYEIPMYPNDAGTMNGISYTSKRSVTQPKEKVDTVALGSFNKESPFYQLNQNDLKPFAMLEIRRLSVYPLVDVDCAEDEGNHEKEEGVKNDDEDSGGPVAYESRISCPGVWSDWSPCKPDQGDCGLGYQARSRLAENLNFYNVNTETHQTHSSEKCQLEEETQQCFLNCY